MFALRFIFIVIVTVLNARIVSADALSDLVDSDQYKGFLKQARKSDLHARKTAKWSENRSEFSTLFDENRSGLKLLTWLSPNTLAYTKLKEDSRRKAEYMRILAQYSSKNDASVLTLTALVPQPRFTQQAAANLVRAFAEIRNLPQDPKKNAQVKVRGLNATTVITKTDECRLSIELNRGALLQLASPKCKDDKRLIDFARTLDLGRANKKLLH